MSTVDRALTPADTEAADSVARLASDLRRLRLEADSPTLARLQAETSISRTVLSDAFAGRQLPSARTVDGIVRACGAEPGPWIDRRDALAADGRERAATAPVAETGQPAPQAHPGLRRTLRLRTAVWIAAGTFLLGAVAGGAALWLALPAALPGIVASAPHIVVANGTDPADTPCVDDAAVATGDTRADNSLLEIVWSDKCQAGWGRITRYDGLALGNTVSVSLYPQTAPEGRDRQDVTEQDVQGAYTGLIVRPSDDTLLCVDGSFTVDGKRIDLGDPLCI